MKTTTSAQLFSAGLSQWEQDSQFNLNETQIWQIIGKSEGLWRCSSRTGMKICRPQSSRTLRRNALTWRPNWKPVQLAPRALCFHTFHYSSSCFPYASHSCVFPISNNSSVPVVFMSSKPPACHWLLPLGIPGTWKVQSGIHWDAKTPIGCFDWTVLCSSWV